MRLQIVPARRGALWVRQGFAVFLRQPVGFAGLFAAFLFFVFALTLLPIVGPLLLLALLPLGSLGFMVATRHVLEGRFPLPRAFVEPLRSGRTRLVSLIKLGLVYAAATWAILFVSDLIDGGALDALIEAQATGDTPPDVIAARLADPRLETGVLLRFALLGLLSVPFWHAPALVHWDDQSAAKSLFFSTVACWRNKGAFVVYSVAWLGVLLAFALLANLVFGAIGRPQLVPFIAMPASLLFSTVFYASLYFTFADCFVPSGEGPAASADPPVPGSPPTEERS
jgi:hypothetical protein